MNNDFVPNMTSSPTKSLLYGENNLDMSPSKAVLTATPSNMQVKEVGDGKKWRHVEMCRGSRGNLTNETNNFSNFKVTNHSTSILDIDHYYYYQRCLPIHDYEDVEDETYLEQFSFVNATCAPSANYLKSNNVQRMHFEAGN